MQNVKASFAGKAAAVQYLDIKSTVAQENSTNAEKTFTRYRSCRHIQQLLCYVWEYGCLFMPRFQLITAEHFSFYCVTACNAMHGIAVAFLSIRLSVPLSDACIVTKLNDACAYFDITRNGNHSSLLTPTVVGG